MHDQPLDIQQIFDDILGNTTESGTIVADSAVYTRLLHKYKELFTLPSALISVATIYSMLPTIAHAIINASANSPAFSFAAVLLGDLCFELHQAKANSQKVMQPLREEYDRLDKMIRQISNDTQSAREEMRSVEKALGDINARGTEVIQQIEALEEERMALSDQIKTSQNRLIPLNFYKSREAFVVAMSKYNQKLIKLESTIAHFEDLQSQIDKYAAEISQIQLRADHTSISADLAEELALTDKKIEEINVLVHFIDTFNALLNESKCPVVEQKCKFLKTAGVHSLLAEFAAKKDALFAKQTSIQTQYPDYAANIADNSYIKNVRTKISLLYELQNAALQDASEKLQNLDDTTIGTEGFRMINFLKPFEEWDLLEAFETEMSNFGHKYSPQSVPVQAAQRRKRFNLLAKKWQQIEEDVIHKEESKQKDINTLNQQFAEVNSSLKTIKQEYTRLCSNIDQLEDKRQASSKRLFEAEKIPLFEKEKNNLQYEIDHFQKNTSLLANRVNKDYIQSILYAVEEIIHEAEGNAIPKEQIDLFSASVDSAKRIQKVRNVIDQIDRFIDPDNPAILLEEILGEGEYGRISNAYLVQKA
jgi:predicted  nucleic acid-binding Zn-ribbon protein